MIAVIMAGGVGERFWPRSRRKTPKQLLDLTGRGTMLSLTVDRLQPVSSPDEIFIVTTGGQSDAIAAEVAGRVPPENIIAEPVGRNTAASVGLGALVVRQRFGDQPFVVMPADHVIGDGAVFEASLRAAEAYVRDNASLLTFGIEPARPETGYGYIHTGTRISDDGGIELSHVEAFHEKPSPEVARGYLEAGNYLWNSGIFCWRAQVILDAIAAHLPELAEVLGAIDARMGTEPLAGVLNELYSHAPATSIDYGVMEKSDAVVVLRGTFYWNDVGSWESVRELYSADQNGNVVVGDHYFVDATNNTVFSPERAVAVIGLEDIVVVDSGDALLVCRRDRAQGVRDVVRILKESGREDLL